MATRDAPNRDSMAAAPLTPGSEVQGSGGLLTGSQESDDPLTELHTVEAWHSQLTDVGKFSYAALCAISLRELYKNVQWNGPFQHQCLKGIVTYLQQPEQVEKTVMTIMEKEDVDCQPFIDAIKKEETVKSEGCLCIPRNLVWMAMRSGNYDSRMRVLAQYVALKLSVRWQDVEDFERSTIRLLKAQEHVMTEEEKVEKEKKAKMRKIKRIAMIGAATVGGGALLGLTGGLAAPFLAAGAGAIIGGAGAAALGSAAGVAIIGSLFGVAGAGLGGYKMRKRVGDVEEFGFEPLTDDPDVHVTIAVTGWLTEDEPAFQTAWETLRCSGEQYVLRYESQYLIQMGQGIDYLLSFAVNAAVSETLKYTILSGILAAIAWPAVLLSASSVIDNPWSVCTNRTVSAGRQLAEVLLARQQGKRPVTLIGFSLGARVIYYCLQELSKRKNPEGIIEDVVMLGAPVPASSVEWKKFSRVVAGTIVNGYCRTDWLLKFLYRTASVQISIAGLQPINWQDRRMINLDLTEIITGHMDYRKKLPEILSLAGVRTSSDEPTIQDATEVTEGLGGTWAVLDSPSKQGYITPISGYKQRMSKSVSLQSGIAQVERDRTRAAAAAAVAAANAASTAATVAPPPPEVESNMAVTSQLPVTSSSQLHRSHSEEEIFLLKQQTDFEASVKEHVGTEGSAVGQGQRSRSHERGSDRRGQGERSGSRGHDRVRQDSVGRETKEMSASDDVIKRDGKKRRSEEEMTGTFAKDSGKKGSVSGGRVRHKSDGKEDSSKYSAKDLATKECATPRVRHSSEGKEISADCGKPDIVDLDGTGADRVKRPQSLPLSSWDEVAPYIGEEEGDSPGEERGVASGASSPKFLEEISETINKIQQLSQVGGEGEVCSREKVEVGEWYGGAGTSGTGGSAAVVLAACQETQTEGAPPPQDLHVSSSQESIEA